MAKRLFVGGLSWGMTDKDLHKAFASYGEVTEAKVITERDTGRSRGFGFVTFARDEDAKAAISKMHIGIFTPTFRLKYFGGLATL